MAKWRQLGGNGARAVLPIVLACWGCIAPESQARWSLSEGTAPPLASTEPAGSALHVAGKSVDPSNPAARPSTGDPWGLSRAELWARWNALRGDAYELDALDRFVEPQERRVRCAPEHLVIYRGATVRYHAPLTVNPAFRDRLERFEEVVAEVGREVYGRAPRRIRHYGAYSCRASRNRSYRLSEHALGNAVDVVGFDFGRATKAEPLSPDLTRSLGAAFEVRVAKHWMATGNAVTKTHARFLRELTDRLLDRRDIFRGFVGPGHPGHDDHLHFDVAPWRYVRL